MGETAVDRIHDTAEGISMSVGNHVARAAHMSWQANQMKNLTLGSAHVFEIIFQDPDTINP
jgi:hypothetical protein